MDSAVIPFGATSHDFLVAYFPDHVMHTITEVDEPSGPHLTFYCSCGQHLGVHDKQLEGYMSASNVVKKGALRNCQIKPKSTELIVP